MSTADQKYLIPCYKREGLTFNKGKGIWLWTDKNSKYMDFFSGWAVSGLGHCHPAVVRAIRKQAGELIHLPNNYYQDLQGRLAKVIIQNSFKGKVFFCNSGAESIEGAIKLARIYGRGERNEIITMKRSFHGRTMGAMSATGQSKFHKGLRPILKGFKQAEFGSMTSLKKAVGKKTVAVMLEPIQGEGGVNIADKKYFTELKKFCSSKDLLLIFDEVQTGMGRTGKMFCHQHYGVKPDIMLLAKSLGGGFPIGAIVAAQRIADLMQPGMHASTFGGSPLACAASLAVFEAVKKEKVLQNVQRQGKELKKFLDSAAKQFSVVKQVRSTGLMAAIELAVPARPFFEFCLKNKMLINVTQESVVRLAPPLNVKPVELRAACNILKNALTHMQASFDKQRKRG